MRILTLIFRLLIFAAVAYSQEEGDRRSAIPEVALAYVEPAQMVLIEALSQSGVTANDTTHDLDTMYVSLSDFENSPYNPSYSPPLYDPPPSFFDSIQFERIVFLPWSRKPGVHKGDYAAIGYQKLSTCDSVTVFLEWKYIPADVRRRRGNVITFPEARAAEARVVCEGKTWKIINWKRQPLM